MSKRAIQKKQTRSRPGTRRVKAIVPAPHVDSRIVLVRGQKVLLDIDLAAMYGVPTKVLNQAVRRNLERFPADFMFQLTWQEAESIRSQFVTLNKGLDSQGFPIKSGGRRNSARGRHIKFRPFVFTEQGVAMLSSVLRSPRAVKVNIEIMRAFVRLRQLISTHAVLARRLDDLEAKYDKQFGVVFDAIRALMSDIDDDDDESKRPRIGFKTPGHDRLEARRHSRGPRRQLAGS